MGAQHTSCLSVSDFFVVVQIVSGDFRFFYRCQNKGKLWEGNEDDIFLLSTANVSQVLRNHNGTK